MRIAALGRRRASSAPLRPHDLASGLAQVGRGQAVERLGLGTWGSATAPYESAMVGEKDSFATALYANGALEIELEIRNLKTRQAGLSSPHDLAPNSEALVGQELACVTVTRDGISRTKSIKIWRADGP